MTPPAVTIVTPSYNQGSFIRATIESVLAQTPSVEYIIMDGGSSDETPSVAADYASRLVWISEKDRGQAHAINKGFAMAGGGIVAWLNADDILLPGAVARAVEAFAEAPHVGAIYGEGYLLDGAGRVTRRFPATEPFNLWKLVHLSDYILQQSTFFRRDAVEQVGGVDENLHYALDWDLLIRLGQKFGLHYVPAFLGMLREHPDAKTSSGGWRRVEEIRGVLERHTGLTHAPGYWTYALDTVQRQWKQRVTARSGALRAPGLLLNLAVYLPAAAAIRHILRSAQGFYPDRWASDRLKWMLPEGNGTVVVRGLLPERPQLQGMELTAVAEGRELGRWRPSPGAFEIRFEAPARSGPFAFELRTSRYFRQLDTREFTGRRLTFLLESVQWESSTTPMS